MAQRDNNTSFLTVEIGLIVKVDKVPYRSKKIKHIDFMIFTWCLIGEIGNCVMFDGENGWLGNCPVREMSIGELS